MRDLTANDWSYILSELSEPFDASEVGWKPQSVSKTDPTNALLVAYIDARNVSDRLNSVVGPQNWSTSFGNPINLGQDNKGNELFGVTCRLTIFGTYKEDVGTPSMTEGMKGAFSDAFKRAAVHFGIGRYLYELDATWGKLDPKTKKPVSPPKLPEWAHPGANVDADDVIFNLVKELNDENTSVVDLGAILKSYHPKLSKVEKRDIYKLLKTLKKGE